MTCYVYKCNCRNDPHQNHYGDRRTLFDRTTDGRRCRWGTPDVVPALSQLIEGDNILAYQTDRNSLIGLVVVDGWGAEDGRQYVYLRPRIRLGQDGEGPTNEGRSGDRRNSRICHQRGENAL